MDDTLQPPEIEAVEVVAITAEEQQAQDEALMARLNALGDSLQAKLKESIDWRKSTGIEEEWEQAEHAYQGEDDANAMLKPATIGGPFTTKDIGQKGAPRSKVFLNITGPYVDAAAARISDMILPGDETPWKLKPTPVTNSEEMPQQFVQFMEAATGTPGGFLGGVKPAAPAMPPMPLAPVAQAAQGGDPMPQGMPAMPAGAPTAAPGPKDKAEHAAELATKQIEDWLVECQWHSEVRKVIEDAARLGTGVLKGPFPVERKARRVVSRGNAKVLERFSKVAPASRHISVWDFFPAPGCGVSIQTGSYCWERDRISTRGLRDLLNAADQLDYIPEQIQRVLEESKDGGTGNSKPEMNAPRGDRKETFDKTSFEIWYFYGHLERDDLIAAGVDDGDMPEGCVAVPAIVTMVNGIVIKAVLNPLDDGTFPYDLLPWKRRTGLPYGRGVGWQMLTPQRMLNASARTMMENLGLGAGPQIIVNRGMVVPADGKWELSPRKLWFIVQKPDDIQSAKAQDVFSAFNVPSLTAEFMSVIQFSQKMAEDVTGLPMLMQGQQGAAPDTVGGMTILNNNSNTVLRRIARSMDSNIYEPHITRYYEYLLEYGENDEAKEDFQLDAQGSTVLVERDIANQAIIQMGTLVVNPIFGADPELWFEEMVKAQKMDPKRFKLTDSRKAQLASQQQPPPQPQVDVAKINADSRLAVEKLRAAAQEKADMLKDATARYLGEKEIDGRWQATLADLANKEKLTLAQIKEKLFSKVSTLNTQTALSNADRAAPQVAEPAFEPPAQAKPGFAFTQ